MSITGDIPESFVDIENKVKIEETSVNLDRVKKEPKEEALDFEDGSHARQYRIALEYENVFGQSSSLRKFEEDYDNLIGFLDNDVIMENTMVKLEYVKEEDESFNSFYCSKCKGNYKGYCLKCSTLTLTCILNNNASFINHESEPNTIPSDILEITDTSTGKGVFLLRTLPINIIFGPFEGVLAIESIVGYCWKINHNKLVNIKNGNWMKNIVCAANGSFKNLDIFQSDGYLYFRTNREITEGEELLIYFDDKELQALDNSDECLYTPQKKKMPKIFACTLCCLGFSSNKCLMEHKRKCTRMEESRSMKDFEIIECHYCKMWMEKWEHEEYHVAYCLEIHHRLMLGHSQPVDRNQVKIERIEDRPNTKAVHGKFKCAQYFYETSNKKNLRKHLHTHKTPFQCDICMMNFNLKDSLKKHIQDKHIDNGRVKKYQCSDCSYQTNYKQHYQNHLNWHRGIKPFECRTCKMKFTKKQNFKLHIKNKHAEDGCTKDYQCSECTYQTNDKRDYQGHLNRHRGIKPFECGICKTKFTQKGILKMHIKNKHTKDGCIKDYQCSDCSYQTNVTQHYQNHLNRHRGIKPFECGICMMKFTSKQNLEKHIKNKHTEGGYTKEYQCSECSFQTNYKQHYQTHLNRHRGIKQFECGICKTTFAYKANLERHIKHKHTEDGCAKDYQCTECSFQTNDKHSYQTHLNGHRGIKPFECDICKTQFTRKSSLKKHIKNKHTEDGCVKDYQCSACVYQTNYKELYQNHLNRHRGMKPFECGICKTRFTNKQNLERHIKNKHTKNG